MLKLIILMLWLLPVMAEGQTSPRCEQVPNLVCAVAADTVAGPLTFNGTFPLVFEGATDDAFETTLSFSDPSADAIILFTNTSGTVCLDTGAGCGTGGSSVNYIQASSCMLMTGSVSPLFMTSGSCIDPHEAEIEARIEGAMVFTGMECFTSADPGAAETITVTGRSGTCGSLSDSGTFACTLTGGSGRAACDTGANTLSVGDEGCWSIKLAPTAGITDVAVNCSLKRSS